MNSCGVQHDPALFEQSSDIWLGRADELVALRHKLWRAATTAARTSGAATDPAVYNIFNRGDARYAVLMVNPAEISVSAPGHKARGTSGGELVMDDWVLERYKIRANGQPSGASAREVFIQALITAEPDRLLYGFSDINLPIGHEQELREFARVFTALPRERFLPVLDTGLLSNLAIRILRQAEATYFYIANPTPLRLNAVLEINSDKPALPLTGGEALKIVDGSSSHENHSRGIGAIRAGGGQVRCPNLEIISYKIENPSEAEQAYFTDIRKKEIGVLLADQHLPLCWIRTTGNFSMPGWPN